MNIEPLDKIKQKLENPELQFEIFKLEYEQAAQRFENIYQAIWQIFSYLSAIAAAIAAFGASNLSMPVVIVIALLPLGFWFFAIYIPMDFYGHRVGARLADMEDGFNEKFLKDYPDTPKLKLFEDFKKHTKAQPNCLRFKWFFKRSKFWFFRWFKRLFKWLNNPWQNLNNPWQTHWRVRYAISVFALVAAVVWFLSFCITIKNFSQLEANPSKMEIKLEPPVQVLTQDSQLQELKKELLKSFDKKLDEKLDPIRSLISERNLILNKNAGKPR